MKVRAFAEACVLIRDATHPRLPIHSAIILMEIMDKHPNGVSNVELAELVGLTTGALSRQMDGLSDRGRRHGREAFDLVRSERDPDQRHINSNTLSKKGERLFKQIKGIGS